MTKKEKIEAKAAVLMEQFGQLRHNARHNGAAIGPAAGAAEIAAHVAECDTDRVSAMWQDICTIDRIKCIVRDFNSTIPLHLYRPVGKTTEQLMALPVNDPSLAISQYTITTGDSGVVFAPPRCDWAVLRVTRSGTEIISYGGGYYQAYTSTDDGPYTQQGDTELLKAALEAEPAEWMCSTFAADLHGLDTYTEDGVDYYVVPCDLPGDIDQLLTMCIYRSGGTGETPPAALAYTLNTKSCNVEQEGMKGLPLDIWLIYDNSQLVSAPKGLLLKKSLVDGTETGIRWDRIEIRYNALVSGMERLRLVSDAFGDDVIISTQDDDIFAPTWTADAAPQTVKALTLQDAINLHTAFAACKRSMAAAGLDVSGAKYVKDLAPILDNHVPEELADVAQELAADPDVAELRQALEECANNGNFSDAIYYPTDKVNWEEVYA